MNLFNELESKLQKIDANLGSNSNIKSINSKYDNDCERINQIFDLKQELEKYIIECNKHRGILIKQIICKRDRQLNQVIGFVQNMGKNHEKNLNKLKKLYKTLKSNYLVFAPGLVTIYDSILFRTKLENRLNLSKLIVYSKFMQYKEENFAKAKQSQHLLRNKNTWYTNFYKLSSNSLVFWSYTANEYYICRF